MIKYYLIRMQSNGQPITALNRVDGLNGQLWCVKTGYTKGPLTHTTRYLEELDLLVAKKVIKDQDGIMEGVELSTKAGERILASL